MSSADLVAVVLLLAMAAYTCGGGADFGAGFWDLVAGGQDRGAKPRALIDYAMAPVWEANNVWLVFVFILTWTGFPPVFEAVLSTAWIPLTLAALGLVVRGAGFALRKPTVEAARRRRLGKVFGVASLLTPFFLAAAIGGVASGRIPPGNRAGDPITSWLNPTSMLFAVAGVASAAFIGAVFLVLDARRYGDPDLVSYFRRRSLVAAGALVVTMAVGLIVLYLDARPLFVGVTSGSGLLFAVLTLLGLAATVVLISRGVRGSARVAAIVAVGSLVLTWGLGQRPYMLPTTLTVAEAAGDPNTLRWLLIVTVVAVLLVGPALALLYRLDLTDRLAADHDDDLVEAPTHPLS